MCFDEIWALKYEQVCAFFEEQPGMLVHSRGHYTEERAEITLSPLPEKRVGSLSFPQTRVRIEGDGAVEISRRFRLRFLTAGG